MSLGILFAQIAGMGPRKEKLRALKLTAENADYGPFFQKAIKYAMDPTIMFNVGKKSLKSLTGQGDEILTEHDFLMLDRFSSREITRTGAAAWVNDRMQKLGVQDGALLAKIIDKDLDWGLGASAVNSVIPGLITEFNVQLAEKFDATRMAIPSYIEPKYDGMRVIGKVVINKARLPAVSFYTRSGKEVESLSDYLRDEVWRLALMLSAYVPKEDVTTIILDGEIMGDSFKETMQKGRRKSEKFDNAKFYVFDWLSGDEFTVCGKTPSKHTLMNRAQALDASVRALDPLRHIVRPQPYVISSQEEASAYYETFRGLGYEGAIVKNPDAGYLGDRSHAWMKMKAEETLDLEIVDFLPGEPGTKYANTLGKLVLNHKGVMVKASGMSDEERDMFWNNKERYRHKFAEIEFQEETPDGSLRHPRYKNLRMDKSTW